ncbi:MAG: hypothetical protein SFY80_04505 [Verrucomicrobiota bacterium]|nr:hypothetical protein [Verrucomicrobiota bacterium]
MKKLQYILVILIGLSFGYPCPQLHALTEESFLLEGPEGYTVNRTIFDLYVNKELGVPRHSESFIQDWRPLGDLILIMKVTALG